MRPVTAALLAVCFSGSQPAAADMAADRAALTAGVREIAAPGLPGSLCVFGDRAFTVVLGKAGRDLREPVVAAGRVGKGRVVAFGHDGYFGGEALATADTGRLLVNAVRWAGGGKNAPRVGVCRAPAVQTYLTKQGIVATLLEDAAADRLKGIDVLVGQFSALPAADRTAAAAFARRGGGLVGAETGWGWQQIHNGTSLEGNGGNAVFAGSGLVWTGGTLDRTAPGGFAVGAGPATSPALAHAGRALDALAAGGLSAADSGQAVWAVTQAVQALPAADTGFLPRLRALLRGRTFDFTDLAARPVTSAQPLARLAMTLQTREAMRRPAAQITAAHPSAVSFPGPVPAGAPRPASQRLTIDTRVPGRHSTGLYAAPGEKITVTLTASAGGGDRLRVRIGAHTDTLWHHADWRRAPEITRTFPLERPTTVAANAFGGPVYIEVPENASPATVTLVIGGAVRAPHFVKDKTSVAEWKAALRVAPGPWAELEGKRCILTVPSSAVRALDDPQTLLAYWDEVVDRCAALYALPPGQPRRPERFCVDRQISAGYMHAGYPIMTGDDVAGAFTDLALLRGKDGNRTWGFYHELGHNFQEPEWTFSGTGEVTNNLFSLYAGETFNDVYRAGGDYLTTHAAVAPAERAKRLEKYLAGGAKFEEWQRDPFLALTMYLQLRRAFGWEPFTKVFAEYRRLPESERPRSDADRRDQWMVRFSKAVNRNLGPFFVAWGVPTGEPARRSVAGLPAWMPDDLRRPAAVKAPP